MEYIKLGPAPTNEECLSNNHPFMLKEVMVYKRQLERQFPGAIFKAEGFSNDFGRYYEVVVYYKCNEKSKANAAYIDDNLPMYWDDESVQQLKNLGIRDLTHRIA